MSWNWSACMQTAQLSCDFLQVACSTLRRTTLHTASSQKIIPPSTSLLLRLTTSHIASLVGLSGLWMHLTTRMGQSLSRRMPVHCHRFWTCWGWCYQVRLLLCSTKNVFGGGCHVISTPWNHVWYQTWKFVICALISLTYEIISSWYHSCSTMISYMISYMIS